MDALLFGDQSHPTIGPYLRELVFFRPLSPLVSCFLADVGSRLRNTIARLPALQQQKVPPFVNLEEFIDRYTSASDVNPIMESTLLCIAQLADYLALYENEPDNSSRQVVTIGLSMGLISSATVPFLPRGIAGSKVAVCAVEIAFRLALYVDGVSDLLHPAKSGTEPESWAIHASGLTKDHAESLIEGVFGGLKDPESKASTYTKATPRHGLPYISGIWPSAITISGPPLTLRSLQLRWDLEQTVKPISARALGPYHASHLEITEALDKILDYDMLQEFETLVSRPNVLALSVESRVPYKAQSLKELYKQVVVDILTKCQDFSTVFESSHEFSLSDRPDCSLLALGPVNEESPLVRDMQSHFPLVHAAQNLLSSSSSFTSSKKDRIAIVGMSGRFPGAQNHDEFWKLLYDGVDTHREVPADRFDAEKHTDPSGKGRNKSHTPFGCFVDNPGLFDPRFFNMSPREATQTDPMQRLALITAYEALEMAGYVPNRTPSTRLDRIGTFYGQTSDDWREINEAQDIDTYFITGGVRAFGPGRINYHFGFSGPSFNIDTACSSSMAAIHTACNSLWLRDCDTAIAGGMNIMTNPDIFAGLSKGQFLSKTGPCQTFDNDADGYCRGDAVGSLILKRLSDAEADNDNIIGVIRSVATNHSADAISITHPHAGTQEILYRRVLNQAGVDAEEISYVEMHGTGTQAGDDTEMRSVTNVFAPIRKPRKIDRKVYVGSVKANVGHGEASSGVTAVIKVLLMMRHNMIPPHVGIKRDLNRGFPDLTARNVHIARRPVELPRFDSETRKIFLSNFSAAGGNTATVMEAGTKRRLKGSDPRQMHVVAVSARALSSLKMNLNNLLEYLNSNQDVSLPSLSYTTTARRIQHNYRISIAASDISKVRSALIRAAETELLPVPRSPKIAFTFTGQGSMYPGVASDLFKTCSLYRQSITEFDVMSTSFGFPSIKSLANGTETRPIAELSPVLVQVTQVCIQMALTRVWNALGITPDVVIGHSLGEYAALFAASVLSASDTIFLVGSRAQLLVTHCSAGSHAMLAVQSDPSIIQNLMLGHVEVACVNGANEVVLSGLCADIESAASLCREHGIRTSQLTVPYAFHSAQVEPILDSFERIASTVAFRAPKCEYLSPLLGGSIEDSVINAEYLCRHAREPVNFSQALRTAELSKCISDETVFVELGPHPVTSSFVQSALGTSITTCHSLRRKTGSWETIATALSILNNKGANVNWGEYHREFEGSLELLELPSYGWALSNYWIDYKNDWCLTKGEPLTVTIPEKKTSFIGTTSVQRVVEECFNDKSSMVVAESDLSRPDLKAILCGHMVNGVALCPSSLYGDMGITIGEYMYRRMFPGSGEADIPRMDVQSMEVPKTLILRDLEPHTIKIVAETSESKQSIKFAISSHEGEHATFTVRFGLSSEWLEEWKRTAYLVDSRIKALREQGEDQDVHKLHQGIAYKLFSAFVDYDEIFQGMKRVYLNPGMWEATADVVLEPAGADQSFVVPPFWIDSFGHLSGFIMNVQTDSEAKKNVYVSHGWDSLRLARTLMPGMTYRTYVRMTEIEGTNVVSGDVYCMEGSEVIALFGGVKFMRIPRKILDQVLPRPRTAAPRAVVEKQVPDTREDNMPRGVLAIHAPKPSSKSVSITSQILMIIAEECGVDQSELADPNSFADLGVDSLMQLAISSRIREDLELEVSASLFIDYSTVGALKSFFRDMESAIVVEDDADIHISSSTSEINHSDSNSNDSSIQTSSTPLSNNSDIHEVNTKHSEYKRRDSPVSVDQKSSIPVVHPLELSPLLPDKRATSFLLQGNPKTASTKLFLFPDGGGSAASYAPIPDLSPDVAVFGLNSPFMTTPEEYTCGVSGIARYYLEELKRRQPQGPYNVGGWSAGGVIAFEGAQQLIRSGDTVDRLILIDSPCPLTIEPLPISLHKWFNTLGLLGDGDQSKIPVWLLPHFQASINALSTYNARAIDHSKAPTTYVIWCEDGVCKHPSDPRPSPYPYGHAQFLLENKEDLGPQLWESMVGMANIRLSHIPGNHFTMMRRPFVHALGDKIREAFV